MVTTLKDIASHTGLSVPTVSLILNGRGERYRKSTRQTVIDAAENLNYRPDSIAQRIGRARTRRDAVGFLIRSESTSRLANTPVHEFLCGVNDVLLEHDQFMVMVKLSHLHETEDARRPRIIAEHFIDGMIVEAGMPAHMEKLVRRYKIPTVWLNTEHHDEFDCVYPDEIHAGRLATQHLIDLGHRRIVYVAPPELHQPREQLSIAHYSLYDRPAGYKEAMAAAGLDAQVVCHRNGDARRRYEAICRLVAESRQSDRPVTGIVTHSLGTVPWLEKPLAVDAGLRCPRDVSLASAEDMHILRRQDPCATGVSCDRYRMGQWAARMLLDKIEQDGRPQASRVYKGQMIGVETTAPPRH